MVLWRSVVLGIAISLSAILPILPAEAASLDLSQYRGKVVYLDFWASWCTPCRQSFPWMNDLQRSYGNRGLVVIGVNVDHDKSLADAFLRETPAAFSIVYDPDGKAAGKYDVKEMPTSIVIGRDGKIAYTQSGFFPSREGQYLAHLFSVLKEQGRGNEE